MDLITLHEKLLAEHQRVGALISDRKSAVLAGEPRLADELDVSIRALVPTGVYEHFKSTPDDQKLYAVFGVSGSANASPDYTVSYVPLYPPYAGNITHRPLVGTTEGFLMPIKKGENKDRPEYEGPRFKLVRRLHCAGLWNVVDDAKAKLLPPQ